ncbi:lantibiotic dehydratase, partial [Streptomyces sp. P17]|uniref:lantibiotic dehydratase n=1 Tax=Streptomyces sp. P17 TaxID=3074716 RepID=UPI0028F41DE1
MPVAARIGISIPAARIWRVALAPPGVWAELVDVPPDARGTNVVIRPAVAAYEIQVGASPSVPRKNVIPLRELVVGVRDDR